MAVTADFDDFVSALAEVDVEDLSDRQLADVVVAAERLLNAAHYFSAAALSEFQRRGVWAEEGALSAAGWVAGRTGSPVRALRSRVRVGTGLRQLPTVGPCAGNGRLSPQHLGALAGCARRHPDLAARDETVLVSQAERLDADALAVVARQWEECADAVDSPDPADLPSVEPVDELHLSRTLEGRYRIDGNLSAEAGELVYAALDAEVDRALRAGRDGDPSVPLVASQVRAAALVDLAAQAMRREPTDASVPDR